MSLRFALLTSLVATSVAHAGEINGTVQGVKDLENVVVYVEHADGAFKPPAAGAIMDQKNIQFVPHVLPVLTGTDVKFPNSDTVRHNVFSPSKAKKFNLGIYPPGTTKDVPMDIPGAQIVSLLCAIHAQLAAFVVVLQNPYFATADAGGRFTIKGVPPGNYTLIAWHEKQPENELPKQKVTVAPSGAAKVSLAFSKDYGRTGEKFGQ
jgi:plastocyanin